MLAWGFQSSRKNGFNVKRPMSLALVYLAWSVLMLAVIPTWPNDNWRAIGFREIWGVLIGASVLWYIWALPLAFAFAFVTRALPSAATLMLSCIMGYLLSQYGQRLGGSFSALGHYLPFYILGARYTSLIIATARWRSFTGATLVVVLYLLLLAPQLNTVGTGIARGILGIAIGVNVAMRVTEKWPQWSAGLSWLGQRTLPIYVLHFPIIAFLGSAAIRHGPIGPRSLNILLFSPTLTAAAIGLSLLMFVLIERAGLGWTLLKPSTGHRRSSRNRQGARALLPE